MTHSFFHHKSRGADLFLAAIFILVTGLARADFTPLEEAHEIIDGGTILGSPEQPLNTYKSAEDPSNPGHEISDEDWIDYTPPSPYIKNTTRNLQFNESEFIASPGAPDGVTTYVQTSDGYTWASMSTVINALWPYHQADYTGLSAVNTYYAGNFVVTPNPGVVKVSANFKAQNMKFYANEGGVSSDTPGAVKLDRYIVTDQWGNSYIMHASGQLDQSEVGNAFEAAILPDGWTKETIQLDDDLILNPAEGSDGSYHYLIFRDSADNTYHQLTWGESGVTLSGQVDGMPIWGGQDDNTLFGDITGPRNDLIHGADGNDIIIAGQGNDEIWGDGGIDTAVFDADLLDFILTDFDVDLDWIELTHGDDIKNLYSIEYLQFNDGLYAVSSLVPEPVHYALILALGGLLLAWRTRRR